MKLRTLLEGFSEFSLASNEDNAEILRFYHDHQMQTDGLSIYYDRGVNFFDFLKVQGEGHFIFLYRDEQDEIKGVATITTREHIVNGQKQNVLYLGDLRAKANREVSRRWKHLYSLLMKHINEIEEFKSNLNFTVIMHSNLKAINRLVKDQNDFEYVEISPFKMVNVFCKIPFFPTQKIYRVDHLKNINEVEEFINKVGVKYQLGLDFDLFKKRFEIYENLTKNNVLKILKNNEVIATCLLWEPSKMKKIILKNLPWHLRAFNNFLSLLTYAPSLNEELKVLYINDLIIKRNINKDEVIKAVMDYLNKNKYLQKYHSIAYASFDKSKIILKGYLKDETPLLFYTVRTPGREAILDFGENLNFNMSWV